MVPCRNSRSVRFSSDLTNPVHPCITKAGITRCSHRNTWCCSVQETTWKKATSDTHDDIEYFSRRAKYHNTRELLRVQNNYWHGVREHGGGVHLMGLGSQPINESFIAILTLLSRPWKPIGLIFCVCLRIVIDITYLVLFYFHRAHNDQFKNSFLMAKYSFDFSCQSHCQPSSRPL